MNLQKMQLGGKTMNFFWVNFPFSLLKMMHMVHQLLMPSCGNGTTSWCYDGLLLVTAPHGVSQGVLVLRKIHGSWWQDTR